MKLVIYGTSLPVYSYDFDKHIFERGYFNNGIGMVKLLARIDLALKEHKEPKLSRLNDNYAANTPIQQLLSLIFLYNTVTQEQYPQDTLNIALQDPIYYVGYAPNIVTFYHLANQIKNIYTQHKDEPNFQSTIDKEYNTFLERYETSKVEQLFLAQSDQNNLKPLLNWINLKETSYTAKIQTRSYPTDNQRLASLNRLKTFAEYIQQDASTDNKFLATIGCLLNELSQTQIKHNNNGFVGRFFTSSTLADHYKAILKQQKEPLRILGYDLDNKDDKEKLITAFMQQHGNLNLIEGQYQGIKPHSL